MLEFKVEKQKLTRLDVVEPATDSQQYLKAKFTVKDADWNGKAKTAYFRLGESVYKALLDSNNECIVPSEVLVHSESKYARTQGSKIFVSLVGEYGTVRITTDEVCVVLNASGYSDALTPAKPTESEYQQIITQYANNEAAINEAKAECETARADLVGVKNIFANAIKGNLSGAVVFADDVSPVEHNPVVWVHGKNLLKNTAVTQTIDGVTFTANGDGSVTANGTAGANAPIRYNLGEAVLPAGNYLISGQNEGVVSSFVMYSDQNGNNHQQHSGKDAELTLTKTTKINVYFVVMESRAVSNIKVFPMIRLASVPDSNYEPYVEPSKMTVRRCGKNLVKNNMYSMEYGGVTITKNNDQSFYVNGTATQNLYFQIDNELFLRKGRYILSGCGEGGSPDTFVLYLTNDDFYAQDVGNGATFNFDSKSVIPLRLAIYEGAVLNNVLFKPMIRLAEVEDNSFEAYNGADFTPSSDGIVEDITSLSPNMTILTDTEGAIVECEHIKDTNKVLQKIADALNITI